jgi:SpoVK/Ycf46/Vps4 family AAA+-type ATPase
MNAELEKEIEMALVQYEERTKWREWGLEGLRKQGACVALYGPPGTGKTTIAHYMSKRIGRGLLTMNMKDVSGKAPGEIERNIAEAFWKADNENHKTVLLDECEAILWDRSLAGQDSMWMISIVDEVLVQIAKYKGLVVLATNNIDIVDSALKDRCFATLQVGTPALAERVRLWKQKIPARYPLQPTQVQYEKLASIEINGRNVETAIMKEASDAIIEKRLPTFAGLLAKATTLSQPIKK